MKPHLSSCTTRTHILTPLLCYQRCPPFPKPQSYPNIFLQALPWWACVSVCMCVCVISGLKPSCEFIFVFLSGISTHISVYLWLVCLCVCVCNVDSVSWSKPPPPYPLIASIPLKSIYAPDVSTTASFPGQLPQHWCHPLSIYCTSICPPLTYTILWVTAYKNDSDTRTCVSRAGWASRPADPVNPMTQLYCVCGWGGESTWAVEAQFVKVQENWKQNITQHKYNFIC